MQRENNLIDWVQTLYPSQSFQIKFAASDADYRKYYRAIFDNGSSIILMDAPPEKFDMNPYIHVQSLFHSIQVPKIYHVNQKAGFMCLQDFGNDSFISLMLENNSHETHRELLLKSVSELTKLQQISQENKLPLYSKAKLNEEMDLFVTWCIPQYYHKQLNSKQTEIWQQSKDKIVAEILSHANVYVHRDYMIRNLMLLPDQSIGVIDFQDAVWGSICYDIISLTRDAFIYWDEEFTLDIVIHYWQQAKEKNLPVNPSFDAFYRSYEWTGVQRHLKVAGIFTRLKYRDYKDKYISEVPRFIQYLKQTTRRYSELHPLYRLIVELTGEDQDLQQGFTF
ncbi:MAG: phosphotransferase [Neisseriaceae bacterium]|nr:MAG: phosphotransferase [Neisseriaceae bacterium]